MINNERQNDNGEPSAYELMEEIACSLDDPERYPLQQQEKWHVPEDGRLGYYALDRNQSGLSIANSDTTRQATLQLLTSDEQAQTTQITWKSASPRSVKVEYQDEGERPFENVHAQLIVNAHRKFTEHFRRSKSVE